MNDRNYKKYAIKEPKNINQMAIKNGQERNSKNLNLKMIKIFIKILFLLTLIGNLN